MQNPSFFGGGMTRKLREGVQKGRQNGPQQTHPKTTILASHGGNFGRILLHALAQLSSSWASLGSSRTPIGLPGPVLGHLGPLLAFLGPV